ncbi:hypothetical protein CU098_007485 [Rhizopus stolonifer]|uniref:Uncharacterized protein n=1 Tax=Rhizopus stolonifer TaxID=4846 RepID=A0A367JUB7_RHIST|nr:hypothetical protein CU098_007485 [Rhizopus stolonifer]
MIHQTMPKKSLCDDKIVQQLLRKLDEGTHTIINLRSLLTCKSAELNELVRQLELIDQALTSVENGTEYIEVVLQDTCSSDKLLDAEAALDSAIQSASRLCLIDHYCHQQQDSAKRQKLLSKMDRLLKDLDIVHEKQKYMHDDIGVLQKAYKNLDLASTVATSIKTSFNHRQQLLKRRNPPLDRIKQIDNEIKRQLVSYKLYTRNAPLYINQQDIDTLLELEDKKMVDRLLSLGNASFNKVLRTKVSHRNLSSMDTFGNMKGPQRAGITSS